MPFWRKVCACLAPSSSLKCQEIRNASQHEAFQTHMWQEIWHQLYKCQMSRIKQYGYSISSAILVPCAWACSIRKTAFQLWVIALLALGMHVWKYSWVTNWLWDAASHTQSWYQASGECLWGNQTFLSLWWLGWYSQSLESDDALEALIYFCNTRMKLVNTFPCFSDRKLKHGGIQQTGSQS